METQQKIKESLAYFYGSMEFHKHPLGFIYTEGCHYLAEAAECYWLLDLVGSYLPELKGQDFLSYKLTTNDSTGLVVIEDGNHNELARQEIPFTDFPLDEITIWAEWNGAYYTAMLPSER